MNTLIFVDKELAVAIAAKLYGMLLQETRERRKGVSLNWLIQANVSGGETQGIGKDIRAMLPEDIVYLFYDNIQHRYSEVPNAVAAMAKSGEGQLWPGDVVSVSGSLAFPDLKTLNYDPFSPPNITVPTFTVHGEKCFVGQLTSGGFAIPTYFPESAKEQVCFCNEEPVEVIGVLRWSPPYRPKGATSLNKVIRVAAALLR